MIQLSTFSISGKSSPHCQSVHPSIHPGLDNDRNHPGGVMNPRPPNWEHVATVEVWEKFFHSINAIDYIVVRKNIPSQREKLTPTSQIVRGSKIEKSRVQNTDSERICQNVVWLAFVFSVRSDIFRGLICWKSPPKQIAFPGQGQIKNNPLFPTINLASSSFPSLLTLLPLPVCVCHSDSNCSVVGGLTIDPNKINLAPIHLKLCRDCFPFSKAHNHCFWKFRDLEAKA